MKTRMAWIKALTIGAIVMFQVLVHASSLYSESLISPFYMRKSPVNPTISGKIDRNNVAVSDDDCTGEQGQYWYDSTDSAFEFCNANSGAPDSITAGSGDITAVGSCATGSCATIGNGATSAGYLDLLEDSDNGVNYARLIGPTSTADVIVTLPAETGIVCTTGSVCSGYQASDATLTDIADGTIAENLVNTANPWADDEVSDTLTCSALAANSVDAITEIATGLKSGADLTLITGTSGTTGHCAQWNVDGDLVTAGAACGGITAYDDIGDPDASGSIGMGAFTGTYTSATDGWGGIIISSTVANNASPTTLLTLKYNDANDATNMGFLKVIEDADGTPVTLWDWSGRVLTMGAGSSIAGLGGIDLGSGTLDVPNGASDSALADEGKVHLNTTDEQLSFHSAADGEISGEVSLSLIQHKTISFDPDAVCDGAVDRLFIMTVGDDAPEGITIDEWKVSFEADPTTEADLDLKYADAFIGVANAAVVDVLDTTNGASSEDTDANINGGAAVANGKVIYLEFGTAYTETTHQIIFEMWYHPEED